MCTKQQDFPTFKSYLTVIVLVFWDQREETKVYMSLDLENTCENVGFSHGTSELSGGNNHAGYLYWYRLENVLGMKRSFGN